MLRGNIPAAAGLALALARPSKPVMAQAVIGPDTVTVASGPLVLRALLWRPAAGAGRPLPAVLFNHGSAGSADSIAMKDPAVLGPLFARHGYVFLTLFRQGLGPSRGQGTADGDLMDRGSETKGGPGRNRVQLELLEHEELDEVAAGLATLRDRPEVDRNRVAAVGHSFGGSLTLVLAERDPTIRAAVVFGAAAASWRRSPGLRARLQAAVERAAVPILLIHAANDYSVEPGKELAAELQRLGKPHRLKIYPPVGQTEREGHNFIYLSPPVWERDVFGFLDEHLRR